MCNACCFTMFIVDQVAYYSARQIKSMRHVSEFKMYIYFSCILLSRRRSSDVSHYSCTTSFTTCFSIFCHSYVFFQGCLCPLLDVIDVLHPGTPPSSFPRHHSENACLKNICILYGLQLWLKLYLRKVACTLKK